MCDRFDKTLTTILIDNNVFRGSCVSFSALLAMREQNDRPLLRRERRQTGGLCAAGDAAVSSGGASSGGRVSRELQKAG